MSEQLSSGDAALPPWIPRVLYAAAVYNVAWGAFVVLFPVLPFRVAGMEPPNYPALVQCLGMIVGVYGVGYALAARDPFTLWPLVLVGLLGKVLGPIGFLYAATIGEFPWRIGVTIITNDLVWWLPFVAILLQAARQQDVRRVGLAGKTLEEILDESHTQDGQSLLQLSRQHQLLVICLRHFGCTYCREALADLARQRAAIEAAGVRPVVVHMGTLDQGRSMLHQYGCDGIDHVSDPDRRIYRALGLRLGTLTELFGIRAFWRALVEGTIFRFGFGRMIGNGLQMAGAFLVRDGRIVQAFRHRSSADRPDYCGLACAPDPPGGC